jgi:hypothetical protein
MDPRQRIAVMLRQWLEKTRAETKAIQASDWAALRTIQSAKAELRRTLGQVVEEWRVGNPPEAAANPFRSEVGHLLALETQNGNILAERKRRAQEKKRQLEEALFNLRRVRSTYAKVARGITRAPSQRN